MPSWVRDPALRYAERMELTRSRLALLLTYKLAFEAGHDRPDPDPTAPGWRHN